MTLTPEQIRLEIASHDYSAELMLQHAMRAIAELERELAEVKESIASLSHPNCADLLRERDALVDHNSMLQSARDSFERQRDTLAEALREMLDYAHDCRLCTVHKAQDALAAVKGGMP